MSKAPLEDVKAFWRGLLGAVEVRTPNRAMDIMLNGWLMYQTVACRIMARSAFYQASGAYGFRDQLQDHMALTVQPAGPDARAFEARRLPAIRRRRRPALVAAARRAGRAHQNIRRPRLAGLLRRGLCRGDGRRRLARRARAVSRGARAARGRGGRVLQAGRRPRRPRACSSIAPWRSIRRSRCRARMGCRLMGTGDWNDGMNRVGAGGKGESVWLAWFLIAAIDKFAPLARERDRARARALARPPGDVEGGDRARGVGRRLVPARLVRRRHAAGLAKTLKSARSTRSPNPGPCCREPRTRRGPRGPWRRCRSGSSRRIRNLVLLFTPPFDKAGHDPGYIKGYPPGLRENGGQYTHAATWVVLAEAKLRRGGGRGQNCSTA